MSIPEINSSYIEKAPSMIDAAIEELMPSLEEGATAEKVEFIFQYLVPLNNNSVHELVTNTHTSSFPSSLKKSVSEIRTKIFDEWGQEKRVKSLHFLKVVLVSSKELTSPNGERVKTITTDTSKKPLINWCSNEDCNVFETTARKIDHACNGCDKAFYCSEKCQSADSLKHKQVCVLSKKAA